MSSRPPAEVAAAQPDPRGVPVFAEFFDMLGVDGDVERALVSLTRRLIGRPGGIGRARVSAQVFWHYDRPIAEICEALCDIAAAMPDPAWTLFARNDLALVVRRAAEEYFGLAFQREPQTATAALERVLDGEIPLDADPHVWVEIAYAAWCAGAKDLAGQTLDRAAAAVPTVGDPARVERLGARIANLRAWLAGPVAPADCPDGQLPFALIGFRHPDWAAISDEMADYTDTLAALGHLLRYDGVRFAGDPGLVEVAERLRADIPAPLRVGGAPATVRLYEVERDASRYAAIPDGTWVIVSEWFTHPLAGGRYDLPLHPALRPVFVSFHITPDALGAPGAVDYLRAHAPIGCRGWDTVFLLHAAGIPAFFSGALTSSVHQFFSSDEQGEPTAQGAPQRRRRGLLGRVSPADAADTADGPGDDSSEHDGRLPGARTRDLGQNLAAAHAELARWRAGQAPAGTSDVRRYLALRALGRRPEFRPADPADYRAIDYVDLSDAEFAAMQRGIGDKLTAVLTAVLAGRPKAEVYQVWRDACAADVAAAEAELRRFPDQPELGFDLGQACAAIRATAVVFERTSTDKPGSEINIEFSVDENYKHQLDIVLDSVVERCSRPVRAFVLCRGYETADFERMAALFPTVSFVWLPTDSVDHGNVRGKIPWATIVTMDRTMLPELLPDVDRIIHFDLDALCLADFADLFDIDMDGNWVAAVDEPQPDYGRGFNSLRDSAALLRREGSPELAREYVIRTHRELSFDFAIFNAGLMLLDLAALRAANFCGRYLPYVGRFGINGQRVMNVGVGAARTKLDPDWNRLVRLEVAENPKVAHWAGPTKPWAGQRYVRGRELWQAQEARFASRTKGLAAELPPG